MKIEVGEKYRYVANKGLRPHPNEIIEDGTIVKVSEVVTGGVMLEGYEYPHKVERLQAIGEKVRVVIQITHSNSFLEAFGLNKGCRFNADRMPDGNYFVWDGLEANVEVRSHHCVEVEN